MLSVALKNGIIVLLILFVMHFLIKQYAPAAAATVVPAARPPVAAVVQTFVVGQEHDGVDAEQRHSHEPSTAEADELYRFLFATKPFSDTPAPVTAEAALYAPPPQPPAQPEAMQMFKDIAGIDEGEAFSPLDAMSGSGAGAGAPLAA